jgi:hexosaminidase
MMKARFRVNVEQAPAELRQGLSHLLGEYTALTGKSREAVVRFRHDAGLASSRGLRLHRAGDEWEIAYGRQIEAFRALGRLMAGADGDELSENCRFEMLSLQLEGSRNGVITPDNVKTFIRRAAVMGINTLMLYLEDTYEVPGEPFFGYLRGRYTQAELKDLDDYAHSFGIEMVPCIQALAHMKQALQWNIAFEEVTDTEDVMLAGEEKTYELLGRMIDAARAPFRSDRIHLGMDEAFGLGTGTYREKFGEKPTFDIMNEHLARVCRMCEERSLKPMIWSDMYFRIASPTHGYYDLDATIPQEVIDRIPASVDLVYWDYYHMDQGFYETYIDRHRQLKKEPIMAPGCWNWNHFWTNIPFSLARVIPCMEACKTRNIRQVFMTTWGDDGMECDIYSVLPVIQVFADLAYGDSYDEAQSARNFEASCLADFHGYTLASHLDQSGPGKKLEADYTNTSKWLMWDDPIIGLCEPFQEGESYRPAYEKLVGELEAAAKGDLPFTGRLKFPAQIARVLALKCDLRKNLVKAYRAGDRSRLGELLEKEVKPLHVELEKLWQTHREMWLATYKPFGLEVIEIRYGGQITRVRSLIDRLQHYLDGAVESIPEFETELLPWAKGKVGPNKYRRIATPSAIF